MRDTKKWKNEKGSITIFVLLSTLFFLVILGSVSIFMKNKEIAIEKQYSQIKESYEKYTAEKNEGIMAPNETNNTEEINFNSNYATIEVVWLDTENNIIDNPNAPFMTDGMSKITWNTSTMQEDTIAQEEWYNYAASTDKNDNNQSKWANIKDNNGNYFVWIPRYAYRITYYESQQSWENGNNPTGYCDGYGVWSADGNLKYGLNENIKTVNKNGKKYIIHPAFVDENAIEYSNGGWDYELSGFWISKYEVSRADATATNAGTSNIYTVKPNVISSTNTISEQYTIARNYDIGNSSHLTKNSEWGAVAYLAHSQYGRNGYELTTNNSTTNITGIGNSANYNTDIGVKASTTGNIYGVYDMAGGRDENIAVYNENSTYTNWTELDNIVKNAQEEYLNTKYITKYKNSSNVASGTSEETKMSKMGDALIEVNKNVGSTSTSNTNHLFDDDSNIVTATNPFFSRGGNYNSNSGAGIFASNIHQGASESGNGFRIVLCP